VSLIASYLIHHDSDTGTGSTAEKEEHKGMSRKKKEKGEKGCKTFSSDEEEEGISMYFEAPIMVNKIGGN